ncbi:hypothetical protein BS78_04G104500 [Paspalum vaginatum]|nr:hypothetical protein BS78_04G104500 [Paspalum vaginatum]
MPSLYTRLSVISSEAAEGVDDGYGVLGGVAADAYSLLVASCVLAASVVIWEACAIAATAAALVAGVAWCSRAVAAGRAGTAAVPAATPAAWGGTVRGLAEADIRALLPASPYERRLGTPGGGATCCVCLADVRGGEMVRRLPKCRHLFHVGCIDAWLYEHVTCPLCRSEISLRRWVTTAPGTG